MKKDKKDRKYEEVNYWETMADSLVALLLCILLISLLLILYLVRMPEQHTEDETVAYSEQYSESDPDNDHRYDNTDKDHEHETTTPHHDDDDDGSGGWGGGHGGDGDHSGVDENPYPHPGTADGEGNGKAAVYVEIIDGETNRTIKYENVEFELYDKYNKLQVLSTYYPDKIDFKKYLTDEAGTFYLPEKVVVQEYYLHALTRVPGYDYAVDTKVELDKGYEWNEPYTAKVIMYPEKNIVRLRLRDFNSGKTLTDASFNIVAAEDIMTKDGTVRCKEGDIVDTVEVDSEGYAESKELYLGNYLIQQVRVPKYYAKVIDDTEVKVESKAKTTEEKVAEIREEKTNVRITLADELNPAGYLANAKFTLVSADGKTRNEGITTESGKLVFTDLDKDTTYMLHQESTVEGYRLTAPDQEFTVDVDGLVAGNAAHPLNLTNRIIRISIGIKDMLFRGQVSDVNVAICDSKGELIKSWDSSAIEQSFEGYEPGEYLIVISGNDRMAKRITVEDKAELQSFNFSKWTTADIGTLLGLGMFLIAFIVFLVLYLRHRAKKKEEELENEQVDLDARDTDEV